jgi:TolB-like protein/Flp pilus assembly protein TadD
MEPTRPPKPELRFGMFTVDLTVGELRRRRHRVRLQEQPFQVLALLLACPGELVTREELRNKLWAADTFVDFDHGLNIAINKLREALGDSAEKPRFIETLPRRGYRFIAALEEVQSEQSEPDRAAAEPRRGGPAQAKAGPGRIRSLAVLPLECLSTNPEEEFFADGMTDELITTLAQISALRVVSRTSVMRYKGTRKSLPEIARELKVDVVLEGTVVRSGNRVRIAGQLIDARTDTHLWAKKYESDLRDILAVQNDVAQALAQEIKIQLTPQEQARLALARPVDPLAYEAFLKGRYWWNKRNPEALQKGLQFFQQAMEKDPGYALAYVGIADSYTVLGSAAYDAMPPGEAMPRAKAAALKALELDPALGEAHVSLAQVLSAYDWDFPCAEKEFKRTFDLNPGYPSAHHFYAVHLMGMGRQEQAIAEERRALELDPLSLTFRHNLARALHYARRDDEAIAEERGILEMDPNFYQAHNLLGWVFLGRGQKDEAVAELQSALELSRGALIALANLGYAQGAAGNPAEAVKTLQNLSELSKQRYIPAYHFAIVYAGLDQKDQAFAWLEKAYQERSNYLLFLNVIDPMVPLRSDPRFQDLVRRIGLPP